jgi:hypothetical protein
VETVLFKFMSLAAALAAVLLPAAYCESCVVLPVDYVDHVNHNCDHDTGSNLLERQTQKQPQFSSIVSAELALFLTISCECNIVMTHAFTVPITN